MNPRDAFQINLRAYMEQKGISQVDICNKLDVPASTVSDWVNGRSYPRVDSMQQLADMFDILMSDLQKDPTLSNGNGDNMKYRERLRRDPNARIMLDVTDDATPEEMQRYVDVIKAMRKRYDE